MVVSDTYSTVVIGAGSGGLTVAIGLAALGRRVALVEVGAVGGDCTNVGCIPSKTLIHLAGRGDAPPAQVLASVQARRDHLRDEETESLSHTENLTLLRGRARFVGPRQLEVDLRGGGALRLSGESIVIATGSRPRQLHIPGLPAERTLTNESVFEQHDAPEHLAIVGAGVIAMELAFAFRKLGSRVSVLARGERVLAEEDPAVAEVLHAALAERGVDLLPTTTPSRYDEQARTLYVQRGGQPLALEGVDRVLLAVGRERNLEQLGLEHAGVAWSPEGVRVDSFGQTSAPGVYAIGDITPTSRYTHSANAQGRRVVQRIAFPFLPALGAEPLYPRATFSDPEVASVGMGHAEIARRYHPGLIKRLRVELPKTDKGYTEGLARGFILVDSVRLTGRILGATIVGPRASEMIALFTLAISRGISLYRLYRLVYPYPTLSGGVQKIADTFMRETLPNIAGETRAYLRYRLARPPRAA